MRVEKYICDVCNDRDAELHFREVVDRVMDSSGHGYNDVVSSYDVCKKCLKKFMKQYPDAEII